MDASRRCIETYSSLVGFENPMPLPFFVRLEEKSETCNVPVSTILKFYQETELRYLQVRVLPCSDIDVNYDQKFKIQHLKYVGKELLIPVGLKDEIKTFRRSLTGKELVKYAPEYVTVEGDTMATDAITQRPVCIPSGTTLHIKIILREQENNKERNCIICTSKAKDITVYDDQTIRFSIARNGQCRLDEFVDQLAWWQPFCFTKLDPSRVISPDGEKQHYALLTMLSGPLQPIEVVRKLCFVGYGKKPDEESHNCFVLVPKFESLPKDMDVLSPKEQTNIMGATADFPPTLNLNELDDKLYCFYEDDLSAKFIPCSTMWANENSGCTGDAARPNVPILNNLEGPEFWDTVEDFRPFNSFAFSEQQNIRHQVPRYQGLGSFRPFAQLKDLPELVEEDPDPFVPPPPPPPPNVPI